MHDRSAALHASDRIRHTVAASLPGARLRGALPRADGYGEKSARLAPTTMSTSTTRPTLLERLRDPADRDAWERFATRYREMIVDFARRVGLSTWDADDVAQGVLLDLSRSLRGFEYRPERGRFRDYLGVVVRRRVWRFRDDAAAARGDARELDVLPGSDELAELWDEEWRRHHLRAALEQARRECDGRTLQIFDRLLEGARAAEVAAEFEVSVDVVYKAKQRVRDRVRAHVAERLRAEGMRD